MSVVRGCGSRKTGGVYAETKLGIGGEPLTNFYSDPVVPVDEADIKKVGVTMFEREGVTHLLDWVGEEYYPTMPDFIEEFERHGLSRRLPSTLDFEKLSMESRIFLVHAKAFVVNPEVLADAGACPCFNEHENHINHEEACFKHPWLALEPGARARPGFTYQSNGIGSEGVIFKAGVFAGFPISQLVQVRDDSAIDKMSESSLPVAVVDE